MAASRLGLSQGGEMQRVTRSTAESGANRTTAVVAPTRGGEKRRREAMDTEAGPKAQRVENDPSGEDGAKTTRATRGRPRGRVSTKKGEGRDGSKRRKGGLAKRTNFKEKYILRFGLVPRFATGSSTEVVSADCGFCKHGNKRTGKKKVHVFHAFRTDNIRSHLNRNHPKEWRAYAELDDVAKETYFDSVLQNNKKRNKDSLLDVRESNYVLRVDRSVLEAVMFEILAQVKFEDRGSEGEGKLVTVPLKLAKNWTLVDKDGVSSDEGTHYQIVLKDPKLLNCVVAALSRGLSFSETADLLSSFCQHMSTGQVIYRQQVCDYFRAAAVSNLQHLADTLRGVWAFSLAIHTANLSNVEFCDIRVSFAVANEIHSAHLMAMPLHDSFSGEEMFGHLAKILDSICEDWRRKLLGVTVDGAVSMRGKLKGLTGLIEETLESPMWNMGAMEAAESENLPQPNFPVLPIHLVEISPASFREIVTTNEIRFKHFFGVPALRTLEQQFKQLRNDKNKVKWVQQQLNLQNLKTSFSKAWSTLGAEYPVLCCFSGGLATLLRGSAGLDSTLSEARYILGQGKSSLSYVYISSRLQAKQYFALQDVMPPPPAEAINKGGQDFADYLTTEEGQEVVPPQEEMPGERTDEGEDQELFFVQI